MLSASLAGSGRGGEPARQGKMPAMATPACASAPPRYRLITLGSHGDLLPFFHLAQGLQSLGRSVDLIGSPMHRAAAQAQGLPFQSWCSEADEQQVLRDPRLFHPRRCLEALFTDFERHLRAQVERLRAGEAAEVLIAHPLAVPAAALARAAGSARFVVSACLAPSNLRSCADPLQIGELSVPSWVPMAWRGALWRWVDRRHVDPLALPGLNRVRAAQGLAPIAHFLPHLQQAPDATLTLFPEAFAPAPADWPTPRLAHGFPLQQDPVPVAEPRLDAFLARHPRPWVFTAGTANQQANRFFATAVEALQRLGRAGLLLSRSPEQIALPLPDSIARFAYLPLRSLLPQAAGLVHHGGIGTTAEALRAGVPQLVTPFAFDQFDNAARLRQLGVAEVLPAARLRADRLARGLQALAARAQADPAPWRRWASALAEPPQAETLLRALEQRLGLAP